MSLEVKLDSEENMYGSRNHLVVTHNGEVIIDEYDGGEPEDQSFYRDWKWVPDAIRKAYELGKKDAK